MHDEGVSSDTHSAFGDRTMAGKTSRKIAATQQ